MASSSDKATMQLRTSPGGSMLKSLRNRPLDPPSSLTVTTAHSSEIRGGSTGGGAAGAAVYFFRPRSRVESPVPPPIASTRKLDGDMGITRSPRLLLREAAAVRRRDRDTEAR